MFGKGKKGKKGKRGNEEDLQRKEIRVGEDGEEFANGSNNIDDQNKQVRPKKKQITEQERKKAIVNRYYNSNVVNSDVIERVERKEKKRAGRIAVFKDKLAMYDMIIANFIAGKAIIPPSVSLGNSKIHIGFSNISSEYQLSKYYIVSTFPDYLQPRLFDYLRYRCIRTGVRMNFYMYGDPYKINWESAEMRNKMSIWRENIDENEGPLNVFEYRSARGQDLAKKRIVMSTRYLNDAELNQKRSLVRVAFLIEVTGKRDDESIMNMSETIKLLKDTCLMHDIKIRELRVNLIDWMQSLGPFSLKETKEVQGRISYKVMTDDVLSNFNSYKQGRIGIDGVPLGMDIDSNEPVLRKFKADPVLAVVNRIS